MTDPTYGTTASGTPITDQLIEKLADEAEVGQDPYQIIARREKRGRPMLGSEPSTVESVRLDPDLKRRLSRRADDDGLPVSEVRAMVAEVLPFRRWTPSHRRNFATRWERCFDESNTAKR